MKLWDRIVDGVTRLANGETLGSLLGLTAPSAADEPTATYEPLSPAGRSRDDDSEDNVRDSLSDTLSDSLPLLAIGDKARSASPGGSEATAAATTHFSAAASTAPPRAPATRSTTSRSR